MAEVDRPPPKTYTEADYSGYAHTGPGTLAGRYLRMFWQPVYRSEDLPVEWAKPIRIMSEDLTLYRVQSGKPYLVAFRCAHRGTQLSVGWVEQDCIRCFYHGWKYDGTGQCVEQPAEPRPFVHKVKIKSYPVEEYLGLVFAYLEEGEPPPLPRYPDFEEVDGVRYVEANHRACNYFQNVENTLDGSHVGFVHRIMSQSFDGVTNSPRLRVEETEWGVAAHAERKHGARDLQHFGMPNKQHIMSFPDHPVVSSREFIAWLVPVDDENHYQFLVAAVRVPANEARRYEDYRAAHLSRLSIDHGYIGHQILAGRLRLDQIQQDTTEFVLVQDDVAQIGQGTIADRGQELLGRSDVGIILIRRLWERELRALAAGRPLKEWKRSPDMPRPMRVVV